MNARNTLRLKLTTLIASCDKIVDRFVKLAGQDVSHAVQWHAKDAMRARAARHSLQYRLTTVEEADTDEQAIKALRDWLNGFCANAIQVAGRTSHHTSNPYETLRYEAENAGEAQAARLIESMLIELKHPLLSSFEARLGE